MDQPHLIDGLDRITAPGRRHPGVAVRPDGHRLPSDTGRVTASFAGVAKHYGVTVAVCPPVPAPQGVVEKINHTAAQRWWRTLADDLSVERPRPAWRASREGAVTPGCGRAASTGPVARSASRPSPLPSHCAGPGHGLPGDHHRDPGGVAAGIGGLPRQPVFGATGTHRRAGHRPTSPGRCMHRYRHRHGIVVAATGWSPTGRRSDPRHRSRHRAGKRRDGAASSARPHRRKEASHRPDARAAAHALRGNTSSRTGMAVPASHPTSLTSRPTNGPPPEGTPWHEHQQEHRAENTEPAESTANKGTPARSAAAASLYQQLRAHLAVLRLHDAAEALPRCWTPR